MSDFGGKLRLARERRGISLRQIAASTKISYAVLDALERNDFSKLPGGIFSRSFVRSFAVEIGLDPDETVREFLEQYDVNAAAHPEARVHVPDEESAFESQQRVAAVVLKLLLISVPVVGVILYFTLRSRPSQPGPPPAAQTAAAPAVTPPVPQPAPVSAAAEPMPRETPAIAAAVAPMRLEIHPTAACWVSLTIDGQRVFARVMEAGEIDTREVRDSAVIDVGDAGAFAFSIDGKAGRSLGVTGQVRTARITRETLTTFLK
jgi:cytoskeletal protein RodZ